MTAMENDIAHPSPWRDLVLVCRKCGEKLDGGFGPDGKDGLRDLMKGITKAAGLKKVVRVIETDCLDLCPEKAVSVMRVGEPGTILAVPPGSDPGEVLRRLGVMPVLSEIG